MAGKKGRSGGPRPNSGGARPGAGRPRKRPQVLVIDAANVPKREVSDDEFAQLIAPSAAKLQPKAGVADSGHEAPKVHMDKALQNKLEWLAMMAEAPLPATEDPKTFLAAVMNHPGVDGKLRIEAAKTLMPFVHSKLAEQGKKAERANAAKEAGAGRFAAAQPPRLALVAAK